MYSRSERCSHGPGPCHARRQYQRVHGAGPTCSRGTIGNVSACPGGLRRIPRPRRAAHTRPSFLSFTSSPTSGLRRKTDFPCGKGPHSQRDRLAAPRISISLLFWPCTCSFVLQPPSVPPRTYPASPPSNLPNLLIGVARIFTWLTGTSAIALFVYYVRNGTGYACN